MKIRRFLARREIQILLRVCLLACFVFTLSGCEEIDNAKQVLNKIVFLKSKDGENAVSQKQKISDSCMFCSAFDTAWGGISGAYNSFVPKVAAGSAKFLLVLYALWLAVRIMKLVGSINEPDIATFWRDLATRTFMMVLCYSILHQISWAIDIAQTIFLAFVKLATTGAGSVPIGSGSISCGGGDVSGAFRCLIGAVQKKFNYVNDSALLMFTSGDSVGAMAAGLTAYLFCWCMMLYYPVLLIDSMTGYGIALCFVPLAVLVSCFPVSRSHTRKVLDAIFSYGLQAAGLTIYMAIVAALLYDYLTKYAKSLKDASLLDGSRDEMRRVANASPDLAGFIFICFFMFFFSGVVKDIMGSLVQSAGGGLDRAFIAAKNMAMKAASNVKQLARFGNNLRQFGKDRKAMKTFEDYKSADKKATEAEKKAKESPTAENKKAAEAARKEADAMKKDALKAQQRLQNRGYLREYNKPAAAGGGQELVATKAYDELGKGGLIRGLKRLDQSWHMSSSDQNDMRNDKDGNKTTGEVGHGDSWIVAG